MRNFRWRRWIGGIAGLAAVVLGLGVYLSDKIYLRAGHASVDPHQFDDRLAASVLRADFESMLAIIEKIHPEFSDIVDRSEFERTKNEILDGLTRPMNRLEFWRTATRINGVFRDGHTGLLRPQEEWTEYSKTGPVVPIHVLFDQDGATITMSSDRSMPSGSRLLSLNGQSAQGLRDWITERISGETLAYRQAYGSDNFAEWVWLRGIGPPYSIKWSATDGSIHETRSPGSSLADWENTLAGGTVTPLQLRMIGQIALMTINSFDGPQSQYEEFLEQSFETIRQRNASALIIDIRQNSGGASSQGDLLQSYLTDRRLPALREIRVKASPEVKARYRTLLPPGFRWIPLNYIVPELRGIQTAPDNGLFSFSPDGTVPRARSSPKAESFEGDLYVLIGIGSYSSAAIFAAPLSYWGRATLIGQPTGEPLTFYGDNYEFDLPASKLQATVSHKQFVLFGKGNPREGVQPHILAAPGTPDALALALEHIELRKRPAKAVKARQKLSGASTLERKHGFG